MNASSTRTENWTDKIDKSQVPENLAFRLNFCTPVSHPKLTYCTDNEKLISLLQCRFLSIFMEDAK